MKGVFVIARKEIRQLTHNTQLMISAFVMAFIFGAVSGPALIASGGAGTGMGIDSLVFTYGLMIGLLIGYILSGQTFLREKQEGTIETLLAGPLPIKEIWLGKVIGVLIPAYILTLASTVLMIIIAGSIQGEVLLPSGPIILHIITVVPAFIACGVGVLGFIQLLLGMRENQIINIGVIFGLIFLISFSRELLGPGFAISWAGEGVALIITVALLLAVNAMTRFLNKERIVRTLP
ncbi:MAG: ABC transporter permease [Methanoregulaceae archaeon]|jgi:ABC-2 type transport system permease protein|nr:ABC transporter permease [Methanoregulaceae archaeon]